MLDIKYKSLDTYIDSRGELTEIVRSDWYKDMPIKQVYMTSCLPGVVKAWHRHSKQTDRMVCIKGIMKFAFADDDGNSQDIVVRANRPVLIEIPPNIWHGFKNIGGEEALVVNCPNQLYNYEDPDEIRESPDSEAINYDWYEPVDG